MQAQTHSHLQPQAHSQSNMISAMNAAHVTHLPTPPPSHNLGTADDMVLEGQVKLSSTAKDLLPAA